MTLTALMLGLISGLALGSIYLLIALSLTLVLASSGVFNFAQGTVVMAGTVLSFVLGVRMGWTPLATVSAIMAVGVLGGLLTHAIAVWPAMGRSKAFAHTTVLTTLGLGTAVNAAVALIFGAESWRVPSFMSDNPLHLGGIPVRPIYLAMIGAGLLITLVIDRVLRRTAMGHMFRSTLEDPEGAMLLGIDVRKIILGSFLIAGALSGLAGFLIAPVIQASAFTAQELAFLGVAGMAIGGFGSFGGALLGGMISGLIAGLAPVLAGPTLTLPILFVVTVGVLLVRPSGLLGTAGLFGSSRLREI